MTSSGIESILIGKSRAIQLLRDQIARFAPSRLPVLIQGPTGSGKELVARALHAASGRSGNFVPFNVCALADTLFEDALFGHVRGAFTGAMHDRHGYLAEANGGTVFLDELAGTTTASQLKLLRAIETGAFRPVGAAMDRLSDFRVIAACNQSVETLVAEGAFRRDLLHRLAGVILEVPPLSARAEDVTLIAQHFLDTMGFSERRTLTTDAAIALAGHTWPGNVRELKHSVERAAILSESSTIDVEHIEGSLGSIFEPADDHPLEEVLARRELIRTLLESEWDTAEAARRLGVHRATVYRRMRQLQIDARSRVVETSMDRRATRSA